MNILKFVPNLDSRPELTRGYRHRDTIADFPKADTDIPDYLARDREVTDRIQENAVRVIGGSVVESQEHHPSTTK